MGCDLEGMGLTPERSMVVNDSVFMASLHFGQYPEF